MKITELIAQLEAVKAEHGDLSCVINYSDYGKRSVKGIIYREGRPTPWKNRTQPSVEIRS